MSRPSIGLVGCGRWGELILRDLKSLGCRVSVVAQSEESVSRAKIRGADLIVPDVEALPGDIEGAVVVTPTDMHAASIEALLPRSIPIFVEKAMTHDPAKARSIVERAGNRVFVMDKWRYHPGIEAMRQLLASGRMGRLVGLRSIRWGWSTTHNELDPVWLLLPHDLAITLHILGRLPPPVAAFANPHEPRGAGIIGFLGDDGECMVTVDVSSIHPVSRRSVILVGEDATAELGGSYDEAIVIRYGRPASRQAREERMTLSKEMPLQAELARFLAFLKGGPPPMSSAAEGLQVVETIVALRRLAGIDP